MRIALSAMFVAVLVTVTFCPTICLGQTVIDCDFSQGSFAIYRRHSFSQLVLLGTENFDDQVFNKVVLKSARGGGGMAIPEQPAKDYQQENGMNSVLPK